jgi:hypothetical protein
MYMRTVNTVGMVNFVLLSLIAFVLLLGAALALFNRRRGLARVQFAPACAPIPSPPPIGNPSIDVKALIARAEEMIRADPNFAAQRAQKQADEEARRKRKREARQKKATSTLAANSLATRPQDAAKPQSVETNAPALSPEEKLQAKAAKVRAALERAKEERKNWLPPVPRYSKNELPDFKSLLSQFTRQETLLPTNPPPTTPSAAIPQLAPPQSHPPAASTQKRFPLFSLASIKSVAQRCTTLLVKVIAKACTFPRSLTFFSCRALKRPYSPPEPKPPSIAQAESPFAALH